MDRIIVKGGNTLKGEVGVEGAKKCSFADSYSVFVSK